jgi:DNA invertase Pin-like site-specific DNA recombinase
MRGRKLPDETIASIRAMRAKGHSLTEIVSATGFVKSCISRHCRGVKLPNGPLKRGGKRRVSVAAVRQLLGQRLSCRAIAARLGCGSTAVHRAITGIRSAA